MPPKARPLLKVKCHACDKTFFKPVRRRKFKRNFCSIVCMRSSKIFKPCAVCQKQFYVRKSKTRKWPVFCSYKCKVIGYPKICKRGKDHWRWKGGRYKNIRGYIQLYDSSVKGNKVFEHRLVFEKFIKRKLRSWEWIHHKNGIKNDNRIENLEIVTHVNHHGKVECPYCLEEFRIH